jgi:hypothetical protein
VEGIRQALFHRIKELHGTEIIGFYADSEYTSSSLLSATKEFNDYLAPYNIKVRGFVTDSKELREMGFDKYFNLNNPNIVQINAKIVGKDIYSSNASFEFYPKFIKIIFFDTAVAIIIESETVAKALRQIFELLWSRIGSEEFNTSKFIR